MRAMTKSFFVAIASLVLALVSSTCAAQATKIEERFADVNGLKMHYLVAGKGAPVILLHGYAQNSHMWRPLMKELAQTHLVIAPDLRGFGDTTKAETGYDKKTMAQDVHALAQSLGIKKAGVAGHDIGLMVAYAYAAQFPAETEKLVVMDAFLPGVGDAGAVYNNPDLWHFRFHGPTPEALVRGRERAYYDYYWNDFAANKARSIPEADRVAYATAYARPGRMRAGWAYFASFPQAAKDFAEWSARPLTMPVLSIGGEKSLGDFLGAQMKLVAADVKVIVLKNTGHWLMEENPSETMEALKAFLS